MGGCGGLTSGARGIGRVQRLLSLNFTTIKKRLRFIRRLVKCVCAQCTKSDTVRSILGRCSRCASCCVRNLLSRTRRRFLISGFSVFVSCIFSGFSAIIG